MFRALEKIGVRKFQERGENVGVRHPLLGEMAVRVEFRGDDDFRADDRADPLQQIALAVVVALRDHRAVQTENHAIDRQRGAQLVEDLVAQILVGLELQQPARLRPGRCAFDQREPFELRPPPQHHHRRRAQRRRIRMLAGPA